MSRLAVLLLLLAMAAGMTTAGAVAPHRSALADGTSTSTSGTSGGHEQCSVCL